MPFIPYRDSATPANDFWWGMGARSLRSNLFVQTLSEESAFALVDRPATSLVGKFTTAMTGDGLGDRIKFPPSTGLLVVTADSAGDGIGVAPGNPTLAVGTFATPVAHTISTLDIPGDQDYYQVTLEAGKTYQIGMYSYAGGPSGVPLSDSYIEVLTADGTTEGHLVVSADGGASTPPNNVNSGLDVLLTFEPTVTGTYYINARAFGNASGPNGDEVGDYELFVNDVTNDPSIYRPYYSPDEPLYAIDWGTMVNRVNITVRNPDGDEGIRATGNDPGTPIYGSALDVPALAAAQGKDITGKNVITIYFAREGDVFVSEDPANPGLPPVLVSVGTQDWEKATVWTALGEFSKVADIVYLEVDNRDDADFVFTTYAGTPGPGISLLGSMSPPDYYDEGLAQFNSGDYRWTETNLQQGGFSYVTLIHEFGHGHGLAHPHDNGGNSGVMHGVDGTINTPAGQVPDPTGAYPNYTMGDYDLNQQVFTMMSYQDGWPTSPYGNAPTDVGYGYLGGLGAFDVAAIQDKYGVNENYNSGDTVYTLKDVNAAGTFYTTIWDTGGTDQIVYAGSKNSNVDLRAATLQYEYGGGGWVSYAYGIFGGFTIANAVVIENAKTDTGNDTLRGNGVNNKLESGAGNDMLFLQDGGDDTVLAGIGNDVLIFGAAMTALDKADGGAGTDQIALQGNYTLTFGAEILSIESLAILPGSDARFGDTAGNFYDYNLTLVDANVAAGTQMVVDANRLRVGEDFTFNGSAESDGSFFIYGGGGTDTLTGGAKNDVFYFGENGQFGASDNVNGGSAGTDQLGLRGNYTIAFGASQLIGIESIGLVSAQDTRFGALGTTYNYNLTMNDGNVAAGVLMTVDGAPLRPNETLTFNGSAESNGSFRIFGGQGTDTITGSQNGDSISGGLGADTLRGGGGNDVFVYRSVAESTAATGRDGIQDFNAGDILDLSKIDANANAAGDQAFSFIGASAFSGTAGELRATASGSIWTVQGDINGDGVSDIEFLVVVTDTATHPLGAGDFLL